LETPATLVSKIRRRTAAALIRRFSFRTSLATGALNDLLKLRAETRKAEIGFVSQKQKEAVLALRQSAENRRQERHKWDILLSEAKVDHQILLNSNLELDRTLADIAQTRPAEARKAA
jgi:hypothetical protein